MENEALMQENSKLQSIIQDVGGEFATNAVWQSPTEFGYCICRSQQSIKGGRNTITKDVCTFRDCSRPFKTCRNRLI